VKPLIRPPRKDYVASKGKIGISTTKDDYKPWEVQVRPPKEKLPYIPTKDDSDFKNTNSNN